MQWLVVVLLAVIIVLASKMNEMVFVADFTNITQALDDWQAKSWVDFAFADNECPNGYEAIKNTWKGTVEGDW